MTTADTLEPAATARDASRYASRKFLLAVTMLIGAAVALGAGKIDASTWADVSKWVTGLYMAGNVGAWLSNSLRQALGARP